MPDFIIRCQRCQAAYYIQSLEVHPDQIPLYCTFCGSMDVRDVGDIDLSQKPVLTVLEGGKIGTEN